MERGEKRTETPDKKGVLENYKTSQEKGEKAALHEGLARGNKKIELRGRERHMTDL